MNEIMHSRSSSRTNNQMLVVCVMLCAYNKANVDDSENLSHQTTFLLFLTPLLSNVSMAVAMPVFIKMHSEFSYLLRAFASMLAFWSVCCLSLSVYHHEVQTLFLSVYLSSSLIYLAPMIVQ